MATKSKAGEEEAAEVVVPLDPEVAEQLRIYKEQAEGVGPDAARVLVEALQLRAQALNKLEEGLKESLMELKSDEICLMQILEQRFGGS